MLLLRREWQKGMRTRFSDQFKLIKCQIKCQLMDQKSIVTSFMELVSLFLIVNVDSMMIMNMYVAHRAR